ncbi:MAG: ABC transporter permease [Coprococcus sp.]|nr:ABC transporter permease [Coprococcus sp.]
MGGYLVKRILMGAASLFILVTAAFFLTRMMPGSPFLDGAVSGELLDAMEAEYGLDEPVWRQYQIYISNLLHGDLGISFKKQGVEVRDVIGRAFPCTMALGALSVLVAAVCGAGLGIWHALSQKRLIRGTLFLGAALGSAVPNFVVALFLLSLFGVKLGWFPAAGLLTPAHYVLPVISLSLYPASVVARMMSQRCSEEAGREYVAMLKAKGLKPGRIICFHVLRHAGIPILNYLGPASAFLLTGSFVVETIFTIPGLGREFVTSITNRDYTLILGLTVFMGSVVILMNLVTDLLLGCLDPQVRKSRIKEKGGRNEYKDE